jgi:hypothetical protein
MSLRAGMQLAALAAGAVLAAASLIALAQSGEPRPAGATPARDIVKPAPSSPAATTNPGAIVLEYKMELLDKDHDGFVSRKEAEGVPPLIKVFAQFDRNRDGRLDRAELEEAEKAQPR